MSESERINIGRLLMNIGRLLASHTDRSLEAIGLFRGQAILLMILSDHDGLTHSEIAERLEISPAAATKVIKRMEELNFLQRRADPSDERVSRVFLKEDGWATIQQVRMIFHQNNMILSGGLSPEDEQVLIGLLKQVRENLQKMPVESN